MSRPLLAFAAALLATAGAARADGPVSIGSTNYRAKVFIVQDSGATEAFEPKPARVEAMVARAITNLADKPTTAEAWRSLVSTQDVVGIKVYSEPGPNGGTRSAVVAAVVGQLLSAGIPTNNIILWDKRRSDLRLARYHALARRFGVRIASSTDAGYDEKVFYDNPLLGTLVWGDFEFNLKPENNAGRKSFVSRLVTQQMTKIINITPLMNHNEAGVSGSLYSLTLGSVDNTTRFEPVPDRLAVAVPEIYALPALGDRVVLNIVDALICQYEGEERSLLHYSTVLDQLWFSRDPVALDVLSIQELTRQRERKNAPKVKPNLELYQNAALLQLGVSDSNRIDVVKLP